MPLYLACCNGGSREGPTGQAELSSGYNILRGANIVEALLNAGAVPNLGLSHFEVKCITSSRFIADCTAVDSSQTQLINQ